jgi:multidrug efflux pump subunit AcrA (membrane-fusion protein)
MMRGLSRLPGAILRAVALAAAITLTGCFLLPQEEQILAPPLLATPDIEYRVITAEPGVIEDRVTVGGVFIYPSQHSLKFRFRSGPLRAIYVGYGDDVVPGQLIADLDTDSLELAVRRQEIHLRKAELAVELAQARDADRFARENAALDVELEKLRLQQLREELAKSRLVAPVAGEVVYIAPLGEGEPVEPYRTVVQIADPTEVLLSYTGPKRSEFALGGEVSVDIRGEKYLGEVVMTPLNVPRDAPEEMRELILIRVDDLPATVEKGDTATVVLIRARREDVIVLPRNLVQTYLGRRFVYVLKDGLREERNVEIGIQTPTQVEVAGGLEPGEEVVVR